MTHFALRILRLGFALCVLLVLVGCRQGESEIHLIPDGFVGPVVVVYGVPGAASIEKGPNGESLYRIGSDGVLVTSDLSPEPGWYGLKFFRVREDGSRNRIPYHGDRDELQIFADVDGVTGVEPNATRWRAYVVGIPSQREDWIEARIRAVDEAVLRFRGGRR